MSPTHPKNVKVYREATRAAVLGLATNLVLGALKLIAGLVAQSMALLADAINSLGDVFTSVVVICGLWFAQRPPNPRHPYGHMRAESIATVMVAFTIGASALGMAWETFQRHDAQPEPPPAWVLWIAAANIAIKATLYVYKRGAGKRTGSSALMANAWDHRNDALSSLAVLVGLAATKWGGRRLSGADEIAAALVIAMIIWSAIKLFLRGARELMDMQADDELVENIRREAASVPDVQAVEKLLVRKSGLEYFADIHIEVDPSLTVAQGHGIGHRVKNRLLESFPALRDVLVHLEPYSQPPRQEEAPDRTAASVG